MTWTPMGSDPRNPPALVDGVPAWMQRALKDWLRTQLFIYQMGMHPRSNVHRVRKFDQMSQQDQPLANVFEDLGFDALERELAYDEERYIHFLDYLVYVLSNDANGEIQIAILESILISSGSKWTVGTRNGLAGLEGRVPEGVQEAADAVMALPGNAGSLLTEAWHAAFGVNPDHEKAYAKSVKAVEAAAIPVVSPNHTGATLGTVIGQMRADGNWKLAMAREHATHTTAQVLIGNMQALWTGQNDRHAGQPGYAPSTQAEAEAAVMLAVPLVQLFSSGAIARR